MSGNPTVMPESGRVIDTAAVSLGLPGFVVLAAADYGGELELLVETTESRTGARRRRHRAHLPQVRQQRRHHADPALGVCRQLPVGKEPCHPTLVEVADLQPPGSEPKTDLAQVLQHVPHRRRGIAAPHQPRR